MQKIGNQQSHTPLFGEGQVTGEDKRGSIDGIFNFIQTDGTQEMLIISGNQARRLDLSDSLPAATTQVIDSRIMSSRLVSFTKLGDSVFAGNGLDLNVKFDEDREVAEIMGVAPPHVAPQVMSRHVGTGTEEVGDVRYFYTYYNSSSNNESNPSPFSDVARPTVDMRVLLRMSRPRQRQLSGTKKTSVDRIRIYRTYHGETAGLFSIPGSGTFHFIKELGLPANASHYQEWEDDLADTRLGLSFPFRPSDGDFLRGFPPRMHYMVTHNQRLFGAGDISFPNRLYFSESLLPEAWPTNNNIDLEGAIGQIIKGMVSLLGNLYVFTQSSTWVLSGTAPENFQLFLIDGKIGCVSHFSIVTIDNQVYFASRRGPYRFDGAGFQFLGDAITGRELSLWEKLLDKNEFGNMTAAYLERQGMWLLGVSRSGRTV